jgi:hypothetical protein
VNVGGLVSAAGAASPAIYAESSGRGGAGSAGSVVNVTLAVGGKVSSGTDFNAGSGAGEQHLLALVGLSGPDLGRGGHIRSALDHVPRSREVRRAHHEIADLEVLPGLRMIGHRRDGD